MLQAEIGWLMVVGVCSWTGPNGSGDCLQVVIFYRVKKC